MSVKELIFKLYIEKAIHMNNIYVSRLSQNWQLGRNYLRFIKMCVQNRYLELMFLDIGKYQYPLYHPLYHQHYHLLHMLDCLLVHIYLKCSFTIQTVI